MSTPTSQINICSGVRLNNAYNHTIWFASQSDQLTYFGGKVVKTFPSYTYLRKSWKIKVDATMEQARTWSYLYFRNGNGKYYFYFITNIEYVNDSTVELSLDLDVMQTYAFDYTLLPSFVEREHVRDDSIGKHTVDEGLDTGEFKIIEETEKVFGTMCVLVLATFDPLTTTKDETNTLLYANYDGMFSGLGLYAVAKADWEGWGTKLKQLDDWGKSDGIVAMWMYPKDLVDLADDEKWDNGNVTKKVKSCGEYNQDIAINTKLSGGYVPRNNKLFTYPYNFLYVTNNVNSAATYRYERFGDNSACRFNTVGCISPDASAKIYPVNYNGIPHNFEEGLSLASFPSCAWNQDIYKLWVAQNQNQNAFSAMTGVLKVAVGVGAIAFTGGTASALGGGTLIASGASDIGTLLSQKNDREIQPPQAKGGHSASVAVSNNFNNFVIKKKSITEEYAKIIDDYFTMYGYRITSVKIPNTHVRENWTYTKTIGCNITGNFCNEDLTKIQSIFDKGITFWVDGDNIGNYSLDNDPLTIM